MKLLVIGGGKFFGAALVDAALAAGHEVSVVQRGLTSRPAPAGVEVLAGDRTTDLPSLLEGRRFDAVVDTCGYMPQEVRAATDLLRDRAGRYCFISSISAYLDDATGELVEDVSPLDERAPSHEQLDMEDYGLRKVQCERVVLDAFGDRGLVVRPGLIAGPRDHSERFTYWPRRLSEPGPVLVPHGPDYEFQVIDNRDLADFVLRLVADGRSGAVNAVSARHTWQDLLQVCGYDGEVVYADDDWLLARDVVPFTGLPLWLPPSEAILASCERALSWGLTPRPLAATAADTLAWDRDRGLPPMPNALPREREAELLAELAHGARA
jgi:2'-hydroxyisoflavone reductase